MSGRGRRARPDPPSRPPLLVVDGSNVAHCAAWREQHRDADDVELRARLVDAAASAGALAGIEVVLVFDGAGPFGPRTHAVGAGLTVVGSGGAAGDAVVERLAAAAVAEGRTVDVVSSDRQVRQAAGAGALRVLHAEQWVAQLAATGTAAAGRADAADDDSASTPALDAIADRIDPTVLERLEELRRGS